jgi:hypothetical protein
VTCKHCKTDHKPEAVCWPENWDEDRRAWFVKSVSAVGVIPEYAPAMTHEVEKLSKTSPYIVSEVELFAYLTQSATISKKLARINEKRDWCLSWSRKITRPLTFKIADNRTSIFFKFVILLIIGLPMLVLTTPIRLPFSIWKRWAGRNFHPYFTGWLRKNGIKK